MKTLSWRTIIFVLICIAMVSGLLFGLFGDWLGLSPIKKSGGMATAFLIA